MVSSDDKRLDDTLIALRRILRATELYERELAQAVGLTPAKLRVLQILSTSNSGSATPTAMANQMGVSQATVTALVDQLEKRAFVRRERSNTDKRQTHVVITEAGEEALRKSPSALQQHFVVNFQGLQNWEKQTILATLERVASMLNVAQIKTAPVLATGEIHKERNDE